MGAFNRFLVRQNCPCCAAAVTFAYQFKFGSKRQYDYRPGDVLLWGGNDEGDRGQPLVLAECTPEECPACGYDPDSDAFRLRIERDRLISVEGPLELDELIFGSALDERATAAALRAKRRELGLWRRSSGPDMRSNSGEIFTVLGSRASIQLNPVFAGLSWTGPAFVWVLGTTRTEQLARLLAPLTPLYSRRGYQAPVAQSGPPGPCRARRSCS